MEAQESRPEEEILLGAQRLLVGRLAVLTEFGVDLGEQYDQLYGIGAGRYYDERTQFYCSLNNQNKIRLMFIDEPPFRLHNLTFFCLKEVGKGIGKFGDWHWFTLDQLIICEAI